MTITFGSKSDLNFHLMNVEAGPVPAFVNGQQNGLGPRAHATLIDLTFRLGDSRRAQVPPLRCGVRLPSLGSRTGA